MIDATLATAESEAGLDLALTVTNEGPEPVTLRFRTGQRADFAAHEVGDDAVDEADDGDATVPETEPVWRHGAGRLFTQALDSETLAPGESATYEGTWRDPPPGVYLIVGTLTAEEPDATATATLAVE